MTRRLLLFAVVAAALVAGSGAAWAAPTDPVDVVEVTGPLDQRLMDFVADSIRSSPAQVVILQLNSPGASSGDLDELLSVLEAPPVPVVAYVGPRPARAYGGPAAILAASALRTAAPGVRVGYLDPAVVKGGAAPPEVADGQYDDEDVLVTEPVPGLVDEVFPTVGQLVVGLDGRVFNGTTLATAETRINEDGSQTVVPAVEVRFIKASLWTRFLRLASRPEATFFFLAAGLAAAAFEFYAAGAGVSAAVAALSLFIAGYGLATLPIRWWAAVVAVGGMALYTADFQQNRLGWKSILGTAGLLVGGLMFTDAAPQFAPQLWAVLATVAGIGLFYGFALTTVVRSRFSTRTIGREYLVGREGVAETEFAPEGVVTVDGARWKARSTRAARIKAGDAIRVVEVTGIVLEVDPRVRD